MADEHVIEEELRGEPPRPVPESLRRGPHGRRVRRLVLVLLVPGLVCLFAHALPFVRGWRVYFSPLGSLHLLGLALLALAAFTWWRSRRPVGPLRYVVEGLPLPARILDLAVVPATVVHGQVVAARHVAQVALTGPVSGEEELHEIHAPEQAGAGSEAWTTTFRVGDDVTAVYLPGRFPESLTLYGFLGLRDGLGLVPRAGRLALGGRVAAQVGGVVFLFGVLCASLACLRFEPLDQPALAEQWPGLALGVLGFGLPMLAILFGGTRRERRERQRRNLEAVIDGGAVEHEAGRRGPFGAHGPVMGLVLVAGSLLLGCGVGMSGGWAANALLDRSEAELLPVEITGATKTTHALVVHTYTVEYVLPDDPEVRSLATTPDRIEELSALGMAKVRAGRFGWRWVEELLPIEGLQESAAD